MLKAQATKSKSLRLGMLAVRVRTAKAGHFDAVMKANMLDKIWGYPLVRGSPRFP